MDGIFNINKPTGMTSHDVVAIIRKLLKQKRVGHAGTLDPWQAVSYPSALARQHALRNISAKAAKHTRLISYSELPQIPMMPKALSLLQQALLILPWI